MALKTFPVELQRENSILWELTGSTISSGQTASGVVPMTRMDGGGLWKATLNDVPVLTREQVLAWRATATYCDGGAQPIILPMCDLRHAPAFMMNGKVTPISADVPHSDLSPYDDGTFYQSGTLIIAWAEGPRPLRATTLAMHVTQGTRLWPGQFFTIDHPTVGPRLYRISDVSGITPDVLNAIVTFRPPLREALTAAQTTIEFNHPSCVMRLATPDAMDLTLTLRKFGTPTANFIEAFPPFPP